MITEEKDGVWIAAMFGGIGAIIAYYESVVVNKAHKYHDKSRSTLNEHDLQQVCRLAIARAWEQQCTRLNVVNFDMLVKWCMDNALRTEVSREFTQKRGQCKIHFMSEMEHNADGEDVSGLAERSIYRSQQASNKNSAGIEFLMHDLRSALPQERLKRTFSAVLDMYPPENLNPESLSTGIRNDMVVRLQISEVDLLQDLHNIQFIFMGLRDRYT